MATDDKYDRQLRLWGADGQRKLAHSHVLLLNATPTGTEALKNLILPGIGKFTVADRAKVGSADFGSNFFVTEEDMGKPRAEVTKTHLMELNPDSEAFALSDADAGTFISDPKKLEPYNIVVACDLTEDEIVGISKVCRDLGKSLVVSSIFGLLGYVRLYKPEHLVIESKPTGVVEGDLRLYKPFPELMAFAKTFDLASVDDVRHKHVPFPVLLLHAEDKWRAAHDGKLPGSYKEKEEFTKMLKGMARDFSSEENFQEAARSVPMCFLKGEPREEIQKILEDAKCEDKKCREKFWVLATGFKRFYSKYKEIPLNGKIPDVTADTESYLQMQKIYEQKAQEHFILFKAEVLEVMKERAIDPSAIPVEAMGHFCSNIATIMCFKFSDISSEFLGKPNMECIANEVQFPDSLIKWYFLIRAAWRYQKKHGHYPAERAAHDKYLEEFPAFKETVDGLLKSVLGEDTKFAIEEKYVKEMLRYSNSKIHNIGAIIGGIVGQEAVKLITEIFSPADNTIIFEGASSALGIFSLQPT